MTLSDEAVERAARAVHGVLSRANALAYLDMPEDTATVAARAALEASGLVDQSARADLSRVFYAKALESLRGAVALLVDGLDDEGDRVYLGSTNHADMIRDAWQEMDALAWDEIMEDTQPTTELAAVNLQLQERISDQSERIKELEDRLATAREVICRSAYFVEALADNDPDEPIADNGMTVLGKLQYDAPALALSLRATLDAIKEKNGA